MARPDDDVVEVESEKEEGGINEEEYCPNCGQYTEGELICPNCGAVLGEEEDEFDGFQDDDDIDDDV